jgi:hypothetical protein
VEHIIEDQQTDDPVRNQRQKLDDIRNPGHAQAILDYALVKTG